MQEEQHSIMQLQMATYLSYLFFFRILEWILQQQIMQVEQVQILIFSSYFLHVSMIALYYAASNGHLSIVSLLLKDLRVDPSSQDSYGRAGAISFAFNKTDLQKALHKAVSIGHVELVSLLLEDPRVDPSAREEDGRTRKSKFSSIVFFFDSFSFIALHRACSARLDIISRLLKDPRVDPLARRNNGRTGKESYLTSLLFFTSSTSTSRSCLVWKL
jgi:ankyrin repeat protein